MTDVLKELGELVRAARIERSLSQEGLAEITQPATNRTAVALLEQARRLPPGPVLEAICTKLGIPRQRWEGLLSDEIRIRTAFEDALGELTGSRVTLGAHDEETTRVAQATALQLFNSDSTSLQLYEALCAVLVYYGIRQPSLAFFERYLGTDAFTSLDRFEAHVLQYQRDAIRLFSSFREAYLRLSNSLDLGQTLQALAKRADHSFRQRTPWNVVEEIPPSRLPDLGYISAARVKREQTERQFLTDFLLELADKIAVSGRGAVDAYSTKKRRKVGSLLRNFDSSIPHDLLSPLFAPDPDLLRREAARLAPKAASDLKVMEETQSTGLRNLARYLAADHMDVYVATSMRSDADFASVNTFVGRLFGHELIRPLKLRYFNPTQSWIEDRVAKGLVEALMLKRASYTVYMAQKGDTFGKDSEASVALGQGKPVIVYVPHLYVPAVDVDSEKLGLLSRATLQAIVQKEAIGEDADVDEMTDHQALLTQVITMRLSRADDNALVDAALSHWADFDLYGEDVRIEDDNDRALYRNWLDSSVKRGRREPPPTNVRTHFIGILVAAAANFEKRATVFREVHPLALQVILSSGVLNGILVARTVESCATILAQLIRNDLDLELRIDDRNYRLVERTTGSTIRVISRHLLIANAFAAYYANTSDWR